MGKGDVEAGNYVRGIKKEEWCNKKKRTQETEKRKFPCSEKRADVNVSSFQCILGIIAQLRSPASLCKILQP